MVVFDHLFCVSRAGTREVHNKLEKNRLVIIMCKLLVFAVGVNSPGMNLSLTTHTHIFVFIKCYERVPTAQRS